MADFILSFFRKMRSFIHPALLSAVFVLVALGWATTFIDTGFSQVGPPAGLSTKHEDITNTRHNLSAIPPDPTKHPEIFPKGSAGQDPRRVFTPQTTEICVFCHTPHGANPTATSALQAPLWNRSLSQSQYVLYDQVWSKSFEGKLNRGAPTGYSRLCLSCHDGTVALSSIINLPGSGGFMGYQPTAAYSMSYRGGDVYGGGPLQDPST